MKLRLVVHHDAEAGRWSAVFPETPGCASAGDTEREAVANAKEALALWLEPGDLDLEDALASSKSRSPERGPGISPRDCFRPVQERMGLRNDGGRETDYGTRTGALPS